MVSAERLVVLCARVLVSRTVEMNRFKLSSNSRGQIRSSCVGWVGTNAIGVLTPLLGYHERGGRQSRCRLQHKLPLYFVLRSTCRLEQSRLSLEMKTEYLMSTMFVFSCSHVCVGHMGMLLLYSSIVYFRLWSWGCWSV